MTAESHGIREILIFHLGSRVDTPNLNSSHNSDLNEGASKYTTNNRIIFKMDEYADYWLTIGSCVRV